MNESQIIFIISQPRSGSTYIQNILSNNNSVNTCSEPWVLLQFANQIKPSLVKAPFNNKLAGKAFKEYLVKYPEIEFRKEFKHFLLQLYSPMAKGYDYVIDKTPRYWQLMDEIVKLFPKSKIVVIKRNPVDVLQSIIKTWNLKKISNLYEYRDDILEGPGRILEFCNAQKKNPNVYVLKYEDVVNTPDKTIADLYKWVGLEYKSSVLDTSKNTKYKGKFGDPFQNNTIDPELLRSASKQKKVAVEFEEFVNGYTHYLTPSFMRDYGGYNTLEGRETVVFNEFLNFNDDKYHVNNELRNLRASTSYKIGRTILKPFVFLKRIFK